jgi:hypothetical protein
LLRIVELRQLHAFPLDWVATSLGLVAHVCQARTHIDSLYEVLGVGEAAQLADWRSSLNGHRLARERWLEERFELLTDGMLFNHVPSETKRREALTTPQNQLQV